MLFPSYDYLPPASRQDADEQGKRPEAFKEAIAKNPVVVIDFFATWCGPCKVLAPVIAE